MSSARITAASPDAILKLLDRIAELEAKLAALESQKPVAWNDPDDLLADTAFRWCRIDAFVRPVYLAAGAKPATTLNAVIETYNTAVKAYSAKLDGYNAQVFETKLRQS